MRESKQQEDATERCGIARGCVRAMRAPWAESLLVVGSAVLALLGAACNRGAPGPVANQADSGCLAGETCAADAGNGGAPLAIGGASVQQSSGPHFVLRGGFTGTVGNSSSQRFKLVMPVE